MWYKYHTCLTLILRGLYRFLILAVFLTLKAVIFYPLDYGQCGVSGNTETAQESGIVKKVKHIVRLARGQVEARKPGLRNNIGLDTETLVVFACKQQRYMLAC